MTINHDDNGAKGRFFIGDSQAPDGLMTYVWAGPNSFIIDHTEVGDRLAGSRAVGHASDPQKSHTCERQRLSLPCCSSPA